MVSPVERKKSPDQTLTSKKFYAESRVWKISRKYYMFYFTWLYVVRSTSYAGTTTNRQIVLNTRQKSSHPPPQKKILAQNKKSKKNLQSSQSLDIQSTPR